MKYILIMFTLHYVPFTYLGTYNNEQACLSVAAKLEAIRTDYHRRNEKYMCLPKGKK